MILSMTGFGRAEGISNTRKISVEIKSLNSKSFDLNLKVPMRYKEKEYEIRKILNDSVMRGKVDCYINVENMSETNDVKINAELIMAYMEQLRAVSPATPEHELLKMAVKMPDAVSSKPDELEENEWDMLLGLIKEALVKFNEFRKTEGGILQQELSRNIQNIENYLSQVIPYEKIRLDAVKERYLKTLSEFQNIDETRFYQEMAYYTEKLDIQEEKVRLAQHLKYYEEVMQTEDFNGKKLGFIGQEIGREINTLGSKANHAEIQKLVVMMKDDLEKIKEQTLNVL